MTQRQPRRCCRLQSLTATRRRSLARATGWTPRRCITRRRAVVTRLCACCWLPVPTRKFSMRAAHLRCTGACAAVGARFRRRRLTAHAPHCACRAALGGHTDVVRSLLVFAADATVQARPRCSRACRAASDALLRASLPGRGRADAAGLRAAGGPAVRGVRHCLARRRAAADGRARAAGGGASRARGCR